MKISRRYLRTLIKEQVNLLLEEEDPFAEDEEGEDDAAAEGDDDAAAEGEEGEEGEEEEEEDLNVTPEEEASLSKSADDQILAHIVDFETKAIKSAQLVSDEELRPEPEGEPIGIEVAWYKRPLSKLLYEESEGAGGTKVSGAWVGSANIDIATFANEVARLVQNYDSLIDMEALIIGKAARYITDNYDQETGDFFEEIMDQHHDMRVVDAGFEEETVDPPPAIGSGYASQPGGGA